ncbi:hypothetical protein ACFCXT_06325 [Streptomyces vinaceus]
MATYCDFLDYADGIRSVKVQAALQGMPTLGSENATVTRQR